MIFADGKIIVVEVDLLRAELIAGFDHFVDNSWSRKAVVLAVVVHDLDPQAEIASERVSAAGMQLDRGAMLAETVVISTEVRIEIGWKQVSGWPWQLVYWVDLGCAFSATELARSVSIGHTAQSGI